MKKLDYFKWNYLIISPILFIIIIIILSSITPGYNHLSLTISRLAILKYGFYQSLNFLLLASGFALAAFTIPAKLAEKESKIVWFRILIIITLLLLIETFFPTDAFETHKFYSYKFSLNAKIHLGSLFAFFLTAPYGVSRLVKSMRKDKILKNLANITWAAGYSASLLCYLWMAFLLTGTMLGYLGILQKIIILICLSWYLIIVIHISKINIKRK